MLRRVSIVILGLVAVLVMLVSTVQYLAEPLPAPDPLLPIRLADGSSRPLGELLAALEAGEELPGSLELELPAATPQPATPPTDAAESPAPGDAQVVTIVERSADGSTQLTVEFPADWEERVRTGWKALGPLYELGMQAEADGRIDEAIALLLSIPEGDHSYARARRYVGWNLLTRKQQRPAQAIACVQQSLASNPLDGNAWQDISRVYLAALGIDAD